MTFDPNATGVKGSIFGLPYSEDEASIIILPVPWDVTTSYSNGTSNGPKTILEASRQLDLELYGTQNAWKTPIWMAPISEEILKKNKVLRSQVKPYLDGLEDISNPNQQVEQLIDKVNKACWNLKDQIKNQSIHYLNQGKLVGILGGEHSAPLGLLEALSENNDDFGILQIDAHMDLRKSYEGLEQSHASIMFNALQLPQVSKLVQVGIRDYCPEELKLVNSSQNRVEVFFDDAIKSSQYQGQAWDKICIAIIKSLPENIYISFDIDGLNPYLCPGTGTPVPGGLAYQEAIYLIRLLKKSDKKIIGFDLCEVGPQDNDKGWNGNVGARVLYNLCNSL
jgi:agmatinase